MSLRRALTAAGLTVAATAVLAVSAAPASAGCGTVYVKGQNTVEVCNPIIAQVEDLLEPA